MSENKQNQTDILSEKIKLLDDCANCIYNDLYMYNHLKQFTLDKINITLSACRDYFVKLKNEEVKKSTKNKDNKKIDEFFNKIWQLYPNKKGKTTVKLTRKKILFEIGFNTLNKCIESYKIDKDLKINGGYKELMNGSTFFNGRYEDYLPEENEIVKPIVKSTFKKLDI